MKKSVLIFVSLLGMGSVMAQKATQGMKAIKPTVKCGLPSASFLIKGIDTSASRGVAENYYLWDNGATIVVKFMPGGSQRLRDLVAGYAHEWEKYANIKFKFVPDNTPNTNIRVQLGQGLGHNSNVGTYCNMISQDQQTINLDTTDFVDWDYYVGEAKKSGTDFSKMTQDQINNWLATQLAQPNLRLFTKGMRGTTLHEFGHSLGLLHEQSYPGGIKWNKSDAVYDWYEKTQHWDRDKVDAQVFAVSEVFYTNGTFYDPRSIMQYPVESWQTTDGFSIPANYELSDGDKALIAALYPKDKKVSDREVPKVKVANVTKIDVYSNPARKGLSIYPAFDIQTNSKIGQVYYVARLVDEDGYYIPDDNKNYNWGGYVATFVKGTLLPNAKASYNKTKKNLELFLPYAEIPAAAKGKRVSIEFTVVLDDVVNGQFDKLMYYTSTTPLSLPKQ